MNTEYIVIHTQTVSLYRNSLVWIDVRCFQLGSKPLRQKRSLRRVSHGQRRDKRIKLSSNIISLEYKTIMLDFCKHRNVVFFLHDFVYSSFSFLFFFRSFSDATEEHRATNEFLFFAVIGPERKNKTSLQALEMLKQVQRDDNMSCSHVFEKHKWFKEGSEDMKVGKVGNKRRSSVDC